MPKYYEDELRRRRGEHTQSSPAAEPTRLPELARELLVPDPSDPVDVAATTLMAPGRILKMLAPLASLSTYSSETKAASPLQAIAKSIAKLAKNPQTREIAMERAKKLSQLTDLSIYSPSGIARAATLSPAAQRGFSESIVSSKSPFGTAMMRPSEFLSRAHPLQGRNDPEIVANLQRSIASERLRDLPMLWLDEYPQAIEAGYEGRHRMKALQNLYGDNPVPLNLVKGDQFRMIDSPYYPHPVREYAGEITQSPLELMRRPIHFGERPIELNPLWMSE